jgi:hypothetical protein
MVKVDWRSLAATLSDMTEDEVKRLLDEEIVMRKRPMIVRRLHQRYAVLRTARERAAIMAEIAQ